MHINLFLVPFVIILGLLLGTNDSKRNRNLYIIVCSAVFLFIAAMRSPEWTAYSYGIDTLAYKENFENSFDMDWDSFLLSVYQRYILWEGDSDIGYTGLTFFIGLFTHDFAIFSLIADLLFFIPFGKLLNRYCDSIIQITFACVFYIALLQVFFLGGGRQMYAIGFDLMALLATFDRKKTQTIVFSLLAITIHFSAILFIIPLLLIWIKTSAKTLKVLHLICLFFFPLVLAFPNQVIVFMGESVGMEKYTAYGRVAVAGGAVTFIFLILLLSIFCYMVIKKNDLIRNDILHKFYVMAPMMTLFAPLIRSNGSMIRISLYYHMFLSLLVPYAIECINSKSNRRLAYYAVIGGLAFLTMYNGSAEYYFYWQK